MSVDHGTSIMRGVLLPGERVQRYGGITASEPAGKAGAVLAALAEHNQQLLNASQQSRPPFPTPPAVESAWNRMQDWRGRAAAEPAADHWRVDFVTQLAQSEAERNPTAKLKIAAAGIKSVISALPSRRR